MKLSYYPGCTLKANAQHFEDSTIQALSKLDIELAEMEDWVCCGTVFSLSDDDLMLQLSSIRNLLRAEKQGIKDLTVLCSMCYNTLRQSKDFIEKDPDHLDKVNKFMYLEEAEYKGDIQIDHLLSILKDRIRFDNISEKISTPLKDLKIGAYYGCLLVRPQEYAIDDFEAPTIMEDLIETMGGTAVDYTYKLECCGAYQTITKKDISIKRVHEILDSARRAGCDIIMTSCPLCAYNLDFLQKDIIKENPGFKEIPILYFTQLLAIALGAKWDKKWTKLHDVNPEPILKNKQLI